jgi:tetratricopeptide (TPR) repeat protein
LLQQREDQRALHELRTALRLAPDRAEAEVLFLLARVHRRLGRLDRVESLLRRAQELGGDHDRAQRETWLGWAQSGRLRDAEPHLAALLSDSRDDGAEICEAYVQGYFANLRVQEALELLDAWQRDFPDDVQSYFMRGYLMQALARNQEAASAYRRGLELAPRQTLMRYRLAEVLTEMQELDEATALFRRCVQESPDDADIITSWANCLAVQGKPDEARRLLQQALASHPRHFEALRKLGEIELSQGQLEVARQHLDAAVQQRPYDTTTHNALGKTLRALGRTAEAQIHLDYVAQAEESLARMERQLRLVVDRPRDVELRYDIGLTLLKYGSPDDGVKWLRTVLELQPDHAAAQQALAMYYQSRGETGRKTGAKE